MTSQTAQKAMDGPDLYRRVVTLDDGREAYVYGEGGGTRFGDVTLDLMFADGAVLHDVPPERVEKAGKMLSDQTASKPKPWPEPWETAHKVLLANVQVNRSRKAKKLPKPSDDTIARIEERLAEGRRIRAWREEQEAGAWLADADPEAILAQARVTYGAHIVDFDRWVWLKSGAPDRLILYWSGLYVYTYHADALQVSKVKELPPTRPYWIGTEYGPVVLSFYEHNMCLEELLVPLVAVGVKVALVRPPGWNTPARVDLFDDGADVQRYFDSERAEYEAEIREAAVEKTGAFQEPLPGFEKVEGIA